MKKILKIQNIYGIFILKNKFFETLAFLSYGRYTATHRRREGSMYGS